MQIYIEFLFFFCNLTSDVISIEQKELENNKFTVEKYNQELYFPWNNLRDTTVYYRRDSYNIT